MRGRPSPSRRRLTPAQQTLWLQHSAIVRGAGHQHRQHITWNFEARPTAISRTYQLKLEYRPPEAPQIVVLAPDLVALAAGRRLPQVYSENPPRLCLYLPGGGEWHSGLLLANTIVPWAYLWLLHFEAWLATDEWQGGGVHPGFDSPRVPARNAHHPRWK